MRRKTKRICRNLLVLPAVVLGLCVIQPETEVQTQRIKPSGSLITVTSSADSGAGTLRQAILDANATPGADTMNFSIGTGPVTIQPFTQLPTITEPVTIDGTTQPGFTGTPLITLSGAGGDGILITGGGSTVKSLAISGFINGLILEGPGGNIVTGCTIGSFGTGITINNSPDNRIGGPTLTERNFINANSDHGILILGVTSSGNIVIGNSIGLAPDGVTVQRNFDTGVFINGAPGNFIGGALPGEGNIISGTRGGTSEVSKNILITGSTASGNSILGNTIGPRADGNASVQNRAHGIYIDGAPGTIIGGTEGQTPGGSCTGACNQISGNFFNGITIIAAGADDTIIVGNYLGINGAGTAGLNNGGASIMVFDGATGTVIGGTTPDERNIINNGIGLHQGSSGTTVQGNYIGTDVTGNVGIGFTSGAFGIGAGVLIENSANNIIGTGENTIFGGPMAGGGNLISGGNQIGIQIRGLHAFENTVDFNYVGVNAAGTTALRNNGDALNIIDGAHHNVIGQIPEPPPSVPGDGKVCVMDDVTGNYLKFDPEAILPDDTVQVEYGNGLTGETHFIGAEIEVIPKVRMAIHSVFAKAVVDDDINGSAFGVLSFDQSPEPYTRIFDNNAFDECNGPTKILPSWVGGMTFGALNEANPINNISFRRNLFGWNAQKTQDLSGSFGSAANFRLGFDLSLEKNAFASGTNAILENKPSLVLDNGARNFFGSGEYNIRHNEIHPPPDPIELVSSQANNGIQPPSITSMAFDGDEFGVIVGAQGPPNTALSVELLIEETITTEGGEKRKIVKSTDIEIRLTTDAAGFAFGGGNFTGPEAAKLRSGARLSGKTTVVTFTDSEKGTEGVTEIYGDTSELSPSVHIAGSMVIGRAVTTTGRGISRAFVKIKDRFAGNEQIYLTNTFGYFVFHDVRPFRTYDLTITAKRYDFDPVVLLVDDDLRVDVVANQPAP